jgi:serine/threonine-protein kinase RsbW
LRVLKRAHLKVPTDLKALEKVLSHFKNIEQPSIPKKDWLKCQLALAEGFTNAVRHAHKHLSTEIPIEIDLTLFRCCMEIRIWDYGPPFDLEAYIRNMTQIENSSSLGGRGIPILQKIADRLSYIRTDDQRNCLLIVKYFFGVKHD